MKKRALFLILGILLFSCSVNPITNRVSFNIMSNQELLSSSFSQYQKVLSESKIINNTKESKMIKKVGEKIRFAAEQYYKSIGKGKEIANYKWEFNLIDDPKVINAWCMPGGKVAFYSGIIPICKDENGIAVVMGHEIAHALSGHSAERISQQMVAELGAEAIGSVIKNDAIKTTFKNIYPIGAQVTLLKFGRNQETEADVIGLHIMSMAGYDPREAPIFWERMEAGTGNQERSPQFLSTHPDPVNRIKRINQEMPKALDIYNRAINNREGYNKISSPLIQNDNSKNPPSIKTNSKKRNKLNYEY